MLTLALAGLVFAALLMLGVWMVSVRVSNAGLVDIAWSASFTGLVAIYVIGGRAGWPRTGLIMLITAIWSLRLTVHLWRRVVGEHPREDTRYAELRRSWAAQGLDVNRRFLWFFQVQALAAVLFSTPMLVAAANPAAAIAPIEWAGVLVWAVGLLGEATADAQLARFKGHPANTGRTCREGLWRYSRHPNYFFEWTIWVGFFLVALGSPFGWATIVAPLLMLYILLYVTGIPAAEAASLRSRGDEFRDYQRTTSAFVPWPPRAAPRAAR